MPYVPAKGRPALDAAVEKAALTIVMNRPTNYGLHRLYKDQFAVIVCNLCSYLAEQRSEGRQIWMGASQSDPISKAVWAAGLQYSYEGAFLGHLNYAITRLIQRVPQLM